MESPSDYKCFNDFFYRKLKPTARPIAAADDPGVVVSAADCRCGAGVCKCTAVQAGITRPGGCSMVWRRFVGTPWPLLPARLCAPVHLPLRLPLGVLHPDLPRLKPNVHPQPLQADGVCQRRRRHPLLDQRPQVQPGWPAS